MSGSSATSHEARYHYERRLGEGGSGTVYLVRDQETGEHLALKKLLRVDAKSVMRLKREFRAMQAVRHPHLIKLYDMGQVGDSWFMTMEYLDGLDLGTYLKREERAAEANGEPWIAHPRLIAAFRQLARGIHALHEAGLLHRDLKPSNVIVVDHRVVVLDFGLVRQLSMNAEKLTEDGSVTGTPAYMAPEQLMAKELTAATDWYAFGVVMYEAVSGMLPIDGPLFEMLHAKIETDPTPLLAVAPETPRWIDDLCTQLLSRDPTKRPKGDDILARFDAADPQVSPTHTSTDLVAHTETEAHEAQARVFGRERELEQLRGAFDRAAHEDRSVVVHVRSASGVGKTALLEHFATSLSPSALVLKSRCYELEAMPFKALDGLMDALVLYLMQLDDVEVAHLLPNDVGTLARIFPGLERLHVVKRLASAEKNSSDTVQTRRRAEEALRKLLEHVATRAQIVVWIDDLQWGDADSAEILRCWLQHPSAAPILFVLSYRADEVATSSCLRALLEGEREQALQLDNVLELSPLPSAEVRAMCELRLRTRSAERDTVIDRIVHEAQGNPFLASQLIALTDAKAERGDADLQSVSLDLMVAQISGMLAADAKLMLATLAVAGRPMSPKLALRAAGVKRGGRAIVHDLRSLNLVRTRDVGGTRMLEVYHNRICDGVMGALTADEKRRICDSLFITLAWSGEADPDWLHALALGAGRNNEAFQYGKTAAARANASLAFERAAQLYRVCISLDPARGAELWKELSTALARGGRGVAAAEAALEAAKHATPDEALAWTQLAAAHFVRCGHFARGEGLVREVLKNSDVQLPDSEMGVMATIAWERTRLKMRGLTPTPRPDRQYPAELLKRVDMYMALWAAMQVADPLRAMLFQLRAFRAALDAGEPARLVRVFCAASTSLAFVGGESAQPESDALVKRAVELNAQLPAPDQRTIVSTQAINAFVFGRFSEVIVHAEKAEKLFRVDTQDDPLGNYNRRLVTAGVRLGTLHITGDYPRFLRELYEALEDARATENRSVLMQLTYTHTLAEQIQGQSAKSRPRLDAQRAELPTSRISNLRVFHMASVMSAACATRDFAWAHAYLAESWPRYLKSPLRAAAGVAFMAFEVHGRFLLNEYVELSGGRDVFAEVEKDIRALERLSTPLAAAAGSSLRARSAFLRGKPGEAVPLLRTCIGLLDKTGYIHDAQRSRFALGMVLGGPEGAAVSSAARSAIAKLGVADVEADLRAYYPELTKAGARVGS